MGQIIINKQTTDLEEMHSSFLKKKKTASNQTLANLYSKRILTSCELLTFRRKGESRDVMREMAAS